MQAVGFPGLAAFCIGIIAAGAYWDVGPAPPPLPVPSPVPAITPTPLPMPEPPDLILPVHP